MDTPLQQFFSFNYAVSDPGQNRGEVALAPEQEVDTFSTVDYKVLPRSRGKLWLRLENLADKFDLINHFEHTGSAEVKRVDLEALALGLGALGRGLGDEALLVLGASRAEGQSARGAGGEEQAARGEGKAHGGPR